MNPHTYQHEKMGAAIRALMLPEMSFELKLASAMAEFWHAFHTSTPSGPALNPYMTVRQIMGEGDGSLEDRAKLLTSSQRHDIVAAFWELDRAVSRDYFTFEAQRR
jgi:hypothetical protein